MKRNIIIISIATVAIITLSGWSFFGGRQGDDQIDDAQIVSVIVPNLPSNLHVGKNLFDSKCSTCHGINGAGKGGKGPPLIHKIYEPNHHADGSFVLAAKNGVRSHHWPFGNMPPVEGITDAEIKKTVEYLRHLQRENGIGVAN